MEASKLLTTLRESPEVKPICDRSLEWRGVVTMEFLLGSRSDVLYLDFLIARMPGHGAGSAAMRWLTHHADVAGVTLWLEVKPLSGGSESRLVRFYERFGFEVRTYGSRYQDGGFLDLVRRPRHK